MLIKNIDNDPLVCRQPIGIQSRKSRIWMSTRHIHMTSQMLLRYLFCVKILKNHHSSDLNKITDISYQCNVYKEREQNIFTQTKLCSRDSPVAKKKKKHSYKFPHFLLLRDIELYNFAKCFCVL